MAANILYVSSSHWLLRVENRKSIIFRLALFDFMMVVMHFSELYASTEQWKLIASKMLSDISVECNIIFSWSATVA